MTTDKNQQSNQKSRCHQCGVCNDSSHVGAPTSSAAIKAQWKTEKKARKGVGSLKNFARNLLVSKDAVAKEWFACKRGARNQKRSDENRKLAALCATATKAERHKRSGKK